IVLTLDLRAELVSVGPALGVAVTLVTDLPADHSAAPVGLSPPGFAPEPEVFLPQLTGQETAVAVPGEKRSEDVIRPLGEDLATPPGAGGLTIPNPSDPFPAVPAEIKAEHSVQGKRGTQVGIPQEGGGVGKDAEEGDMPGGGAPTLRQFVQGVPEAL